MSSSTKPSSTTVLFALAIVYLAWGSSYVAIRLGVRDIAPLEFSGLRFLLLAPMMGALSMATGGRLPSTARSWAVLAGTGLIMMVMASGLLAWAQQWVASGQAAFLMASSALWMALFGQLGTTAVRIRRLEAGGLLLGLVGVALLTGEGLLAGRAPWSAYAAVLGSAAAWSAGSLLLRRYRVDTGPAMTVAIQALIGGAILTGLAGLQAEPSQWTPSAKWALLYLLLIGSVAGYSAYYWLIDRISPSLLGSYAYANPMVAAVLGWLILDEQFNGFQIFGALLILLSLLMMAQSSRR